MKSGGAVKKNVGEGGRSGGVGNGVITVIRGIYAPSGCALHTTDILRKICTLMSYDTSKFSIIFENP